MVELQEAASELPNIVCTITTLHEDDGADIYTGSMPKVKLLPQSILAAQAVMIVFRGSRLHTAEMGLMMMVLAAMSEED